MSPPAARAYAAIQLAERLVDVERAAERLLGVTVSSRRRGSARSIRLTFTCAPCAQRGRGSPSSLGQHRRV